MFIMDVRSVFMDFWVPSKVHTSKQVNNHDSLKIYIAVRLLAITALLFYQIV